MTKRRHPGMSGETFDDLNPQLMARGFKMCNIVTIRGHRVTGFDLMRMVSLENKALEHIADGRYDVYKVSHVRFYTGKNMWVRCMDGCAFNQLKDCLKHTGVPMTGLS